MPGGNYKDFWKNGTHFRRIFSGVDVPELEWHRDSSDRRVSVISGSGWELQMDEELPQPLEKGKSYFIEKNTFHRVFSGKEDLVISIEE